MTRDEFLTAVKLIVPRTDKDGTLDDVANWTLLHLARIVPFRQWRKKATAITTVASDWQYDLESDFHLPWTAQVVDGTNSGRLEMYPIDTWDELMPNPSAYTEAKPWFCTFDNTEEDELLLGPVPDAAYTVNYRYLRYPALPTSGSSSMDLSNNDDILTFMGASILLELLEDTEGAERWSRRALAQVALEDRMESAHLHRIKPRGFGGEPTRFNLLDYQKNPFVKRMP